ncbi:MAG: hypothetical protein WC907_04675 [Acholeplasmataceae bacterium]
MITESTLYLITRLDSINKVFQLLTVVSLMAIACIGTLLLFHKIEDRMEEVENIKCFLKYLKVSTMVLAFSVLCLVLIPTTKEAIAIYVIPKIANNEQLQSISTGTLNIVENKFQEWINDLVKEEDE